MDTKQTLGMWPQRPNGEPIFTTTNEAVFYAQLAHKNLNVVDHMQAWRDKAYRDLRNIRRRPTPDLDLLFEYAVKAQFFKECFMEILRIRDEEAQ